MFALSAIGLIPFFAVLFSQRSVAISGEPAINSEPISPLPAAAPGDQRRIALGGRLFQDPLLSHDGSRSCGSCHAIGDNGAGRQAHDLGLDGAPLPLNTLTVFNAAANFRLNWAGGNRTLEDQAAATIENPRIMGSSLPEAVGKLADHPELSRQFVLAYGRPPDAAALLDAIAVYERSLTTPGSRFDRWLQGDAAALSATELRGYRRFKSLGCVSCHQGVNIGGNLMQRHGIFHPLGTPEPVLLRVPSLRNVAETPPYFHDGSAATLEEAVRKMGYAQLNMRLPPSEVRDIVAFLRTLTGNIQGRPVGRPE